MEARDHTVIDKKFVIQRQGRDVVLFAGVLSAAHARGLRGVATSLLQLGSVENGCQWIAQATALFEDGSSWQGIADATPGNVNKSMVDMLPRLAETRAIARALKLAVNLGDATFEESGEDVVDERRSAGALPADQPGAGLRNLADRRKSVPAVDGAPSTNAMTAAQRQGLESLARQKRVAPPELGTLVETMFGHGLEQLTMPEATQAIDALKSRHG